MVTFIKINKREANLLFEKAKDKARRNYESLAKKIGISRDMLFKYKRCAYPVPELILNQLIHFSNFNPKERTIIKKDKYLKKKIKKPFLNSNFAEILGVLNGDGHLSKVNSEVSVIGNLKEMEYFLYLKKKIEKLFKISFKIQKYPHYLKLRVYSSELIDFLNQKYGLPKGRKKGNLLIPKKILSKENLIASYLKGLFDTDGSFYLRRKKDPVIEISSTDERYLKQIRDVSLRIGILWNLKKKSVLIYRKDLIKKFWKLIGPANPKHLKKYNLYLNNAPVV